MANNVIRVGDVGIMALSDGMLEFDLCNFFPTIPPDSWRQYESHLTEEHKVRFNLGSYLIRSGGRTVLVDTGLGPKPADAPDAPWGQLMHDFQAKGVPPEDVDTVVMTHLHRDHVGWNLVAQGEKYVPTFPHARYWMSAKDWEVCHEPDVQPQRFPNAPDCVWPLAQLGQGPDTGGSVGKALRLDVGLVADFPVLRAHPVASVRKGRHIFLTLCDQIPADVIAMQMGHHHRVDVFGRHALGLEVVHELAPRRVRRVGWLGAEPRVDEDRPPSRPY